MKPYGRQEQHIPIRLADWLERINPQAYRLPSDTPMIDAFGCYITTGDARQKTRWLVEQYDKIVAQLADSEYRVAMQSARDKADKFLAYLVALTEKANWLECIHDTTSGEPYILCRRVTSRGDRI
jgi:hypothetical protein